MTVETKTLPPLAQYGKSELHQKLKDLKCLSISYNTYIQQVTLAWKIQNELEEKSYQLWYENNFRNRHWLYPSEVQCFYEFMGWM